MVNQHKSPPKAMLTVRIGVTGHRPAGIESAGIAALSSRVAHVSKEIKRLTVEVKTASESLYASQDPIPRIVSPLAEGADMLAAEVALENGFELQCALPLRGENMKKTSQMKFQSSGTGRC